jgi:hypothetical protein
VTSRRRTPPAVTIAQVLSHPIVQDGMQSLLNGSHPKSVLAGMAGDLFAAKVAEALGGAPTLAGRRNAPPVTPAKPEARERVIDAEFEVIDVTPGVKRRPKR